MPASLQSRQSSSPPLRLSIPIYKVSTITRDEPWLDNGNVIVLAKSDSGDIAWRVDEGALTQGSEYFKTLLASDGEMPLSEDGCKVVQVTDRFATAERVAEVLQLLYGRRVLPIYGLGDSDSFEDFIEFLELAAIFGLWSHFFAALRPFFVEYRERLLKYWKWDGRRDIAIPRNNPIYMLNVAYTAQSLLEHYARDFAKEGDRETHMAMQVLESGCRLDLSLFVSEDEFRHAREPDPSQPTFLQRPGVLSPSDRSRCQDLRLLHRMHAARLRATLADFEHIEDPPNEHIRCCGEAVNLLFSRLWAVHSQRGTKISSTFLLDLIRGLHTDSGRIDACDNCLHDLDAVLTQAYKLWLKEVSPFIAGLDLAES